MHTGRGGASGESAALGRKKLEGSLLYRSRQRGFLELDLLVGLWAQRHIKQMTMPQLQARPPGNPLPGVAAASHSTALPGAWDPLWVISAFIGCISAAACPLALRDGAFVNVNVCRCSSRRNPEDETICVGALPFWLQPITAGPVS